MRFPGELPGPPQNESAMLLMPVGYRAKDARVPKLERKPFTEIVQWNTR